jgi:hypothetical protein
MVEQILRLPGRGMHSQIRGRCENDAALQGPKQHCHHVPMQRVTQADSSIETPLQSSI